MITISDMRRDRGRIKNILITIINKRFNTLNLPKCMICHISQWQQIWDFMALLLVVLILKELL